MKTMMIAMLCIFASTAQAKEADAKAKNSAGRKIASDYRTPEMAAVALVKSMFGRSGDTVRSLPRRSDRASVVPVSVRGTNGATLIFEVDFREFNTDASVGNTAVDLSVKLVDSD